MIGSWASSTVHGKLALIFHLSAGQEIRCIGLLHQHLTDVFLVTQHPINGGRAPLRFACNRFDPMLY